MADSNLLQKYLNLHIWKPNETIVKYIMLN